MSTTGCGHVTEMLDTAVADQSLCGSQVDGTHRENRETATVAGQG